MDDKEASRILKEIRAAMAEGEELGLTPSEIYGMFKGILPQETVYIEKPPVSSEKKIEYMREWRKEKKRLVELELKFNKKEEARQLKIKKALSREGFCCYKCDKQGSHIKCNPSENKHTLEKIRGQSRHKIMITNACPDCGHGVKAWGGYLDII